MNRYILLFILMTFGALTSQAQKPLKKGHLRYELKEVSLEDIEIETDIAWDMNDLLEMIEGSTIDIYFHKLGQRVDLEVPGLAEMRVMHLLESKEVVTLLQFFGQKKITREPIDLDEGLAGKSVLDENYVDIRFEDSNVKTIVGQPCSKVVISVSEKFAGLDEAVDIEIYVSQKYKLPELGYIPQEFNQFKGAPMEVTIKSGNNRILLRAIEFEKKVSKTVFEIPKGYKPMDDGESMQDVFRM